MIIKDGISIEEVGKPQPRNIYTYNSMNAALLNKRLAGMASRLIIPTCEGVNYFYALSLPFIKTYLYNHANNFYVKFTHLLHYLLIQSPHYPEYTEPPKNLSEIEENLIEALEKLPQKGAQLPAETIALCQHIFMKGMGVTSNQNLHTHTLLYTLYLQYMKQLMERWGKLFTPEVVIAFIGVPSIEYFDTCYPIKMSNEPQSIKQAMYNLYHLQRLATYFILYYDKYIQNPQQIDAASFTLPLTLTTIAKLPQPPNSPEEYRHMHFMPRAFLQAAGGTLACWLCSKGYMQTYSNVMTLGEAYSKREPTWTPLGAEEAYPLEHIPPDIFHKYFKDAEPVMQTLNDVVIEFVEFFKNLDTEYIDRFSQLLSP